MDLSHSRSETTTTRLHAVWHESFGQYLKGGLRLAYLDISQAASPWPSGRNTTGYGLGFDLHTGLADRQMLQLGLRFAYDYQSTQGKSPDQVSDILWHAGLRLKLTPQAQLGSSITGVAPGGRDLYFAAAFDPI